MGSLPDSRLSVSSVGFKNLYDRLLSWPVWGLGAGSLLAIVLATRISTWLTLRWAPLAAGSGVSQIKLIYWRDHGHIPWKATAAKFIACSLGLAAGIGLGRRGPSVFICSGVASIVADLMKANSSDRRSACAAGAAAGLAASFNTPLAAVTFFLEEVLSDLNSRRLTIVLLASAMGVAVLHAFIGDEPIYPITRLATVPAGQFLPAIIVAVFSSFMGLAFMKFILALRDHSSRWNNSPYWLYPVLGATLGWAVCFSLFCLLKNPGLFGTGDTTLNNILEGKVNIGIVWALLFGKLLSVCLYYGTGGCGGIFGPLIFLGGASGYAMGATLDHIFHLGPDTPVAMAALGMSACFSCVVRAPITGILMLFEMTHSFSLLPPLMITTIISQAISQKFAKASIYDALLIQSGNDPSRFVPPRDLDQWHRIPVATLANLNPIAIHANSPEQFKITLISHPYQYFPLIKDGLPIGIVTRSQLEHAVENHSLPDFINALRITPATSIHETQHSMLKHSASFALIVDSSQGKLLGVLTLNDILRAELNHST